MIKILVLKPVFLLKKQPLAYFCQGLMFYLRLPPGRLGHVVGMPAVVAVALFMRRLGCGLITTIEIGQSFQLTTPDLLGHDPCSRAIPLDVVCPDRDIIVVAVASDRHNRIPHRKKSVFGVAVPLRYIIGAQRFAGQPAHHGAAAGIGHPAAFFGDVDVEGGLVEGAFTKLFRNRVEIDAIPRALGLKSFQLDDDAVPYQFRLNSVGPEPFDQLRHFPRNFRHNLHYFLHLVSMR